MNLASQALQKLSSQYVYNPNNKRILPASLLYPENSGLDYVQQAVKYPVGSPQYTDLMVKASLNTPIMTGGVNKNVIQLAGGQLKNVLTGKMAGSQAVKSTIPYFNDKGVSIIKDALGNLVRTDLPKAPLNQTSIPYAQAGQWIKDSLGNLKRIDLPSIK